MHQSLPKYLKGVDDLYIYIYNILKSQFILKVDRGQINWVFGDERFFNGTILMGPVDRAARI